MSGIIGTLVIGALAGWLATQFMGRRGFGLLGNIIVGIVGGVLGGLLFGILGFAPTNLLGRLISGTIGAMLLLAIIGACKERKRRH